MKTDLQAEYGDRDCRDGPANRTSKILKFNQLFLAHLRWNLLWDFQVGGELGKVLRVNKDHGVYELQHEIVRLHQAVSDLIWHFESE